MTMQPKAWMIVCLFSTWIFHFIASVQTCGGNTMENKHVLIIDGHNFPMSLLL